MTTRELYSSIGVSACKHEGCWRKDGIFHIRMEAPPSCHKCPKCGNREVIHRVDVYSRCACRSESGSKAKIKAVAGRHRLSFRNIDWLIHRSMMSATLSTMPREGMRKSGCCQIVGVRSLGHQQLPTRVEIYVVRESFHATGRESHHC